MKYLMFGCDCVFMRIYLLEKYIMFYFVIGCVLKEEWNYLKMMVWEVKILFRKNEIFIVKVIKKMKGKKDRKEDKDIKWVFFFLIW